MDIHFTKMEGCGNDYVYINGAEHGIDPEKKPEIVRKLSDRHFGIGGDGVIFINPSRIADFEMEMWNADGTRGEMCGNGIRCVGKYVYDKGLTDKKEIAVESFGKIKYLTLFTDPAGKSVSSVRVNMGAPVLEAPQIPVEAAVSPVVAEPIRLFPGFEAGRARQGAETGKMDHSADGIAHAERKVHPAEGLIYAEKHEYPAEELIYAEKHEYPAEELIHAERSSAERASVERTSAEDEPETAAYSMTCVSMGNPHAVVYIDDVDGLEIEKIGPLFESHPRFPNRVNTEFVEIVDRDHVKMRVWERGTGETLACGTGCCAVCVAGVLNGCTAPKIEVRVLGGTLQIEWNQEKNIVWMTGPATTVFEGVVTID